MKRYQGSRKRVRIELRVPLGTTDCASGGWALDPLKSAIVKGWLNGELRPPARSAAGQIDAASGK
ncbi:hypothetical protein XH90_30305 [Bradyrhizobium sp. CCBAU 53338]|nr:hypothetical protein XH90_30305 [Bradyrhizobium sp. CCBAU 53338]